jgi:hypothetical protein
VPAPGASVPSALPSGSAVPSVTPPAASSSAAAPTTPPAPMKSIGPSAFAEDLKKLGVDPLKPPALNKLSPDVVRKLMPSFAKSLGVKCDFCHDTNNFKASTPRKRVASKMWSEFVVGLQLAEGGPLYCDSCHGGKAAFLDRTDHKALAAWMNENYVKKVKRTDATEQSCESCHGKPFDPKFLDVWEK